MQHENRHRNIKKDLKDLKEADRSLRVVPWPRGFELSGGMLEYMTPDPSANRPLNEAHGRQNL